MSVTFRSGSESYEQLTPDGDLGDTGLNEQFADNRATPSDDSDIYSQVDFYREERERDLFELRSTRGIVPQLTKLLLSRRINAINRCIAVQGRECNLRSWRNGASRSQLLRDDIPF